MGNVVTNFEVGPSPFEISKDDADSIVRHKLGLKRFGGVCGIARSLGVNLDEGASSYDPPTIAERRHYFGSNQYIFKAYVVRNKKTVATSIPIRDLVVGDIAQLNPEDIVPADGIFIPGRKLSIREPPSLTGEEGVVLDISSKRPHLRAGSTVISGSAKMLVTSVGTNTESEQVRRSYQIQGLMQWLKMCLVNLYYRINLMREVPKEE